MHDNHDFSWKYFSKNFDALTNKAGATNNEKYCILIYIVLHVGIPTYLSDTKSHEGNQCTIILLTRSV